MLACGIHRVDLDGFTVVHLHGNGEVVADWQGVLDRAINGMGWDLLLAEYRGYGGSTGEPLLGRMLDDVGAVIAAAGLPEKLVVMGPSVGCFFTLEAVSRFPTIAEQSEVAAGPHFQALNVGPEAAGDERPVSPAPESPLGERIAGRWGTCL